MKKLLLIIILLLLILGLIPEKIEEIVEDKGVFISYIDISKYVKKSSDISTILDNIQSINSNLIILQVISFADSIYNSNIYPNYYNYDLLDIFLKEAKMRNIKVYLWINPYRISSNNDISKLDKKKIAYKYIDSDILYINNQGIYFNPAKKEVEDLILRVVEELVSKYKADGLLIDDYFYPKGDCSYNDYLEYKKDNDISYDEYRLMIISNLVKKIHNICGKYNILFGVSPDGNINNNYHSNFVDVKKWLSSNEYVDFIMPQIYYGLQNGARPYYLAIKEWSSLIKNKDIDLYIALAIYKSGKSDKYAKNGSREWILNNNILQREIIIARNVKYYKGFSLFRYGFLFDQDLINENIVKEMANMKNILK